MRLSWRVWYNRAVGTYPAPVPHRLVGRGCPKMKRSCLSRALPAAVTVCLALSTAFFLFGEWPASPAMARPERFASSSVVIDAGHGGEDGGAVSPSGAVESQLNLAVAQRLVLLLGLYGADVVMLRTEDVSLHDPEAGSLREKKRSDLQNRIAQIQAVPNATLISIHQNTYSGSARSHGAQVFYADESSSGELARYAQERLRLALDPENGRKAAELPGEVYLMDHVRCRAILVECGFLSDPEEEALLQSGSYQTKIAAALASAYLSCSEGGQEGEEVLEREDHLLLYGMWEREP